MNQVELTYNPYKKTSRILINNKTISAYGEIAKYLREPFSVWAIKILDAIARELNDDFELEFISTDIETAILKKIAENNENCKKFSAKNFIVQSSISERIKQYEKISNGSEIKHKKELNICSNDSDMLAYIRSSLIKNSIADSNTENKISLNYEQFCSVSCLFCSEGSCDGTTPEIYISKEQEKVLSYINDKSDNIKLAILISEDNEFCGMQNDTYIFTSTEEHLIELLIDFVEYETVIPLFADDWKKFLDEHKENANDYAMRIVDATEPVVYILCKEQCLEEGASCKIEVKSYPKGVETPEVLFKISNEMVIRYNSGVLYGLKAGNTVVEAYVAGTIEPIYQKNFTVIRRNRITQINIACSNYVIAENQKEIIKFEFLPKDADNVDSIQIVSLDPSVVDVAAGGGIYGKAVGKTRIEIIADKVEAECDIEVKPYMTEIVLSEENIKMLVGGVKELKYKTKPADVINPDISYEISNDKVISFDGHAVKGKSFGEAKIVFYNDDRCITKTCTVEVKSTLANDKTNFFKGLTIVAFILALVCTMISSMASIAMASLGIVLGVCGIPYAISIAKDQFTHYGAQKKPDYVFCIVGIVLNSIAIAMQIM